MLVQQGVVQAFHEAARLWPLDPRRAVLDALQLQKHLVGTPLRTDEKIAPVVTQYHRDGGIVRLEEQQLIVVHYMHRCHRQLRSIQTASGITAVAVDHALQIDYADTLQMPDEEDIRGHQVVGVPRLNMPFPEPRREAFQQPDLIFRQVNLARLLQTQRALVLG